MKKVGKMMAVALILMVVLLLGSMPAEAKRIPRVTNFVILVDQYRICMRPDEEAKKLGERPDAKVVIEGHTDWTGPEAYNQVLSERRAKAVSDYFLSKGVAGDRMKTTGYGETRPEVSNLTREGRAINRRVVIQVK